MIRRRAFEQFRLQQAMEMTARIDRANSQPGSSPTRQPSFIVKPRRFAGGK